MRNARAQKLQWSDPTVHSSTVTWAPVKDNDLYTTPGLGTKVKMIRFGISHPINKYNFFNIQVTKIINKNIYRKYSIEN